MAQAQGQRKSRDWDDETPVASEGARFLSGVPVVAARFRRLVVALDPDEFGFAPRLGAAMARRLDAAVDLVVVLDAFAELFAHGNHALAIDPDACLDRLRARLGMLVTATRNQGVPCFATLLVGAPVIELERHLRHTGADLLLTGPRLDETAARLGAWGWRAVPQGHAANA